MPEPVLDAIDRYTAALRNRDVVARNRLLAAYRRAWLPILEGLLGWQDALATAPRIPILSNGSIIQGVPPSWTFQQNRYIALQAEVRNLVYSMGSELGDVTLGGRQAAWGLGVDEARAAGTALGEISPASWSSAPRAAFEAFTGGVTGGPLGPLLSTFSLQNGAAAAGYARDVLGAGILQGQSARTMARTLEQGLQQLTFARAFRIARTETNRAYREGARASYQRNPNIIQSWAWRAALENSQHPPCAACIAKHGSIHPISEAMQTHPNCRCRMVPRRSPIFGQHPSNPKLIDREEAFGRYSPATQRRILGPTRYEGWRRGTWRLDDFATSRSRGPWGRNDATLRPLRELRSLSTQPRALGYASNRLFQQSALAEARVSAGLQNVAYRTGGSLEGFAFRLKHPERISDKILADVVDGRGQITAVGEGINDALRYTLQFRPEQYAAGVRVALDELRLQGATVLQTKNFWSRQYTVAGEGANAGYRGYHAVLRDPSGARYELQFHTADSLAIKAPSHSLYELQRVSTNAAYRRSVQAQIGDLWRGLFFPPGAIGLGPW